MVTRYLLRVHVGWALKHDNETAIPRERYREP